jgi:malonyl-CoA O-methyltransferase
LKELKAAWASVDDRRHVNRFLSVDEIVKQLRIAGFSIIKHDSKVWVREYPSVLALMWELKGLGAHHVNQSGQRKVTTKSELQKMMDEYQAQMPGSGISASYDILFIEAMV